MDHVCVVQNGPFAGLNRSQRVAASVFLFPPCPPPGESSKAIIERAARRNSDAAPPAVISQGNER